MGVATGPVALLHVIAPAPFGGAETALLGLVAGLVARGEAVVLAIMADARSGPFVARARQTGAHIEVIDSPARNYLRDLRELRRMIRTFDVTIVHTHGYRADAIGGVAAHREGRPHVATAHGFTGGAFRNRVNQFLGVQALRHADAVIAVSAPLAELLHVRGVPRKGIHVVANAWAPPGRPYPRAEARARLHLPADACLIGWVGRLSEEKGPDLAIAALGSIEHARLVLVGDGPMREALERQAGQAGVAPRIHWPGIIPDVWEVLPAFDLLLLSSRTEGTPMILLEAMHAGIPIVATPVGGVPALVHGETGWLASAPTVADIGDALAAALADPSEAGRRAQNASRRVQQQGAVHEWLDAHQRLYRAVSHRGSPA